MCARAIRIFLCLAKACRPCQLISAINADVCSAKVIGDPRAAMIVWSGSHATTSPPMVKDPPPVGGVNECGGRPPAVHLPMQLSLLLACLLQFALSLSLSVSATLHSPTFSSPLKRYVGKLWRNSCRGQRPCRCLVCQGRLHRVQVLLASRGLRATTRA